MERERCRPGVKGPAKDLEEVKFGIWCNELEEEDVEAAGVAGVAGEGGADFFEEEEECPDERRREVGEPGREEGSRRWDILV